MYIISLVKGEYYGISTSGTRKTVIHVNHLKLVYVLLPNQSPIANLHKANSNFIMYSSTYGRHPFQV